MKIVVWLILCLIWGTTWIFIKIGLNDLPPITFAASRFVLAVAILLPIIWIREMPWPRSAAEWKLIALTGFLQFSLNYSAVFWAEQHITSGLAAVLQAMITVFGLLLAWIFLPAERITRLKILAVLLGIIGVAVIFIEQLRIESVMAFLGCVAVVAGAYCRAGLNIDKGTRQLIASGKSRLCADDLRIAGDRHLRASSGGRSAHFQLDMDRRRVRAVPDHLRNDRGILALLLAFE